MKGLLHILETHVEQVFMFVKGLFHVPERIIKRRQKKINVNSIFDEIKIQKLIVIGILIV